MFCLVPHPLLNARHAVFTFIFHESSLFNLLLPPPLFCRYQSSQQHPEAQYVMPYHNMGHYTESPRDEPVMAELSVHREPPPYQESFNQNYPPAPNHYHEPTYQQNIREQQQQQQYPVALHHPHHQYTTQQPEPSFQPQPQPAGPPQGIEVIKISQTQKGDFIGYLCCQNNI